MPRWKKYKYPRCVGKQQTSEYQTYLSAKRRCTQVGYKDYADYGGRGIKFKFDNFDQFMDELGPRPAGLQLDRKNNNGHYEPGNVRWATSLTNNNNRRRQRNAASPISGISWNKKGYWLVLPYTPNGRIYLGTTKDYSEAVKRLEKWKHGNQSHTK